MLKEEIKKHIFILKKARYFEASFFIYNFVLYKKVSHL